MRSSCKVNLVRVDGLLRLDGSHGNYVNSITNSIIDSINNFIINSIINSIINFINNSASILCTL